MRLPRCEVHRKAMVVEDFDGDYRQTVWVCPEYTKGCRSTAATGPSEHSIWRREQGR